MSNRFPFGTTGLRAEKELRETGSRSGPAQPPSPRRSITQAVSAALQRMTTRVRRPQRQKVHIEPLEPRLLLSTEVPVIPPSPSDNAGFLSAPLEIGGATDQLLVGPLMQWEEIGRAHV